MENISLLRNYDGTYTLIIYLENINYEFGQEFFGKSLQKITWETALERYKNIVIKTVKFVIAGGMVITMPFSAFARENNKNFAMSYVYFGSVASQIENVKKSANVIETVSPSYFDLSESGELNIANLSPEFIKAMHADGIKVVPFLSNHWSRQAGNNALDNREKLAARIAEVIEKYNLDGINVDIENVDHTYREKYTDFVRLLREKIPKNKEVSVAVAANPYGWTNGWQGSYDYEKLSGYADYLMVMSYDEHYEGGEPGPVASINFVRDSIEYALEYVPEDKIVMGIPFFGRLWGEGLQGRGISLSRVYELISTYNATVYYDDEAQSPVATFTVTASSPVFLLNGKALQPGSYTLWFENEESLAGKMRLIEEYNIKGSGNWSAGQEHEGIWDYYELWVNGIYFNDITKHFAKNDIIKINSEGIMVGTSDTSFEPEGKLTRAEAAIIVSRIMGLELSSEKIFSDTKGHFAEKYINAAAKKGFVYGYPDGKFYPEREMSRMEMAMLLSRIVEVDYHGQESEYSDVTSGLWAFEEISALTEAGIMKGYLDGTFRPHNPVTRGEMAALINRIEK